MTWTCDCLEHDATCVEDVPKLTFSEYDELVTRTRKWPDHMKIIYPALGVGGEAGEYLEKVKKSIRDHDGVGYLLGEGREAAVKELGDILWYLSASAQDLDLTIEDVARAMTDRKERGVIHGDGDDR